MSSSSLVTDIKLDANLIPVIDNGHLPQHTPQDSTTLPVPDFTLSENVQERSLSSMSHEDDGGDTNLSDVKSSAYCIRAAIPERYFTPAEIAGHNTRLDTWVSFLGVVYDVTGLISVYDCDPRIEALVRHAGRDISHWFNPSQNQHQQPAESKANHLGGPYAVPSLRVRVDVLTGLPVPACPDGQVPHVEPRQTMAVSSNHVFEAAIPWWQQHLAVSDATLCRAVGKRSNKVRQVRIINTLTKDAAIVEYCREEPVAALMERYRKFNAHATAYTWKYVDRVINMSETFEANGIPDDHDQLEQLGLDADDWLPSILLYFSDDLTIA